MKYECAKRAISGRNGEKPSRVVFVIKYYFKGKLKLPGCFHLFASSS